MEPGTPTPTANGHHGHNGGSGIPSPPGLTRSPEPQPQPAASIRLLVRGPNNQSETEFKLKMTTKLGKLMEAYTTKHGVHCKQYRFLIDGERVNDEDTAASLEMEDGDIIEVFTEQIGGVGNKRPLESSEFQASSSAQNKKSKHTGSTISGLTEAHGETLFDGDEHGLVEFDFQGPEHQKRTFMVPPSASFSKMIHSYVGSLGLSCSDLIFHIGTQRMVRHDDTPDSLQMAGGEIVYVARTIKSACVFGSVLGAGDESMTTEETLSTDDQDVPMPNLKNEQGNTDESLTQPFYIRFVGQNEFPERHYRVNHQDALGKFMEIYSQDVGYDSFRLRFVLDGERIKAEQTPCDIGLLSGDTVHVAFEHPCVWNLPPPTSSHEYIHVTFKFLTGRYITLNVKATETFSKTLTLAQQCFGGLRRNELLLSHNGLAIVEENWWKTWDQLGVKDGGIVWIRLQIRGS